MKNRMWIAALAAASLSLVACFKQKTLVVVNPDGSGNIVVSQLMSPQAAGMMGGMAEGLAGALGGEKQGGAAAAPQPKKDPFFDEEKLKKEASNYGEGISYVKGHKSNEEGWQGSVAVYSFADIGKVKLPLDGGRSMAPPGLDGGDGAPAKTKKAVTFEFAGGDAKTLKIKVPQDDGEAKKKAKELKEANPQAEEMGKAMIGAMLPMLKGMEISFAVQVKGQITGTTAMNKESDGRVVLMQMDIDQMQTSPKFQELLAKSQGGEEPPNEDLLGIPGVKVETNQVVEIHFK